MENWQADLGKIRQMVWEGVDAVFIFHNQKKAEEDFLNAIELMNRLELQMKPSRDSSPLGGWDHD